MEGQSKRPTIEEAKAEVEAAKKALDDLVDHEASYRERFDAQARVTHALDMLRRVKTGDFIPAA